MRAEKPKRPFAVALQARQVEQQRRELRRRLALLGDLARLACARVARSPRARCVVPQALGAAARCPRRAFLRISRRTSAPCIRRPRRRNARALPSSRARLNVLIFSSRSTRIASVGVCTRPTVVLWKPPLFDVERGHRARAVDADEPVGLRSGTSPRRRAAAARGRRAAPRSRRGSRPASSTAATGAGSASSLFACCTM